MQLKRTTQTLVMMTVLAAMAAVTPPLACAKQKNSRPLRVFSLDAGRLAMARARVQAHDQALKPALDQLIAEADQALKAGPFSVMNKTLTPPSGDKHDYMSLGPYWWPDPRKPDGLPYIRHDGKVNPESRTNDTDRPAFSRMGEAVETLSLAWYFTRRPEYASHASKLLRVWFLDSATKMNPNLEFGQAIPGRVTGRDIGIIDTTKLIPVVDSVGLLESSEAWTDADQQGMLAWCRDYLKWLRTSRNGLGEEKQRNNHATWYDAQVMSLAFFVGDIDTARTIARQVPSRRIDKQIGPDGAQKYELARTKSFGYSRGNLVGFFCLAQLASHVGIDLWTYQSPKGGSIRKAVDYLAPYADKAHKWLRTQISPYEPTELLPLLRRAAIVYNCDDYEKLVDKMDQARVRADRVQLLWPR